MTYLDGPGWTELVASDVLGRPAQVFRERPRDVLDVLALTAARPELDFLVHGERRLSYGGFLASVDAGAAALSEAGVGPGDRVLVVAYSSAEFLLVQWAAWRLRAVPVLGNRWWSPGDLADVLAEVGPALIVTDVELPDGAAPVVRPDDVAGWWTRHRVELPPAPPCDEDDVALVVYTAGSTGAPKGVQLTHRVLWWTQQTLHLMQRGRPAPPTSPADQKVALSTTPMFHNGAVVAGISALLDGNRIVVPSGRFDAREVLRLIETERVTSWNAVPTMFSRVLTHPDLGSRDTSSLIAPSTGGTTVPPALVDDVARLLPGAGFAVGYGMTEMSFLTIVPAGVLATSPGAVGKPIPGVEMRVHDPDPRGEGELCGRSGAMMAGYLGSAANPVENPIDADGWYHTGDLGRIDDDGMVFVTGRVRDMVIRGGENVACPHVENVLLAHDDVREAAVVGVPSAELGEEIAAVVYRRDGGAGVDELAAFARERLAYFEVPTRWLFTDDPLPTLPTGKIDKIALRALARDAAADE